MKTLKIIFILIAIHKIAICQIVTPPDYEVISKQLLDTDHSKTIASNKGNNLKSTLNRILVADDRLFFKINISNESALSYDIDFVKFLIKDLKTAKRTVAQERELKPIYSLNTNNLKILSNSRNSFVFAFNKFNLPSNKGLFIEIYEKNAGRNLVMRIKNSGFFNSLISVE
ncbi:MAG: traN [Sphingobacteriales bacterium]|nr:traN [Sphingobacteriales bacterium]